ncbi:MAG: multidrug efflux system membrane fusion protein, partial [Psychromonas sp.]
NDKIVINGLQKVRPNIKIEENLVDMANSTKIEALRQAQLLVDEQSVQLSFNKPALRTREL